MSGSRDCVVRISAPALAPEGTFLQSSTHPRAYGNFARFLAAGHYADLVIFDPDTIQDHANYLEPHQLASGVRHVLVNGEQVLADAAHTGALPGRVVRGPGYVGAPAL
ncbi:MAG: hypothetical protein RJQ10_06450 [Haliea sp.]|uniref:hypothetical protein n=1 Tax=Haliea sp. TaxID=1932666 RepID=UPI0032EE486F